MVSIASTFGAATRQRRAPHRFAANRAALDDDEREKRREPPALGFWIVRAGENCRFLGVGEQDRRPLRPVEKVLRSDLAQEFGRRGIDADRPLSRAPDHVENRRARRRSKERVAGEMDERCSRNQRVGDVGGLERIVGAPVGEEAAFAVCIDQRNQPSSLERSVGGEPRRHARILEARRLALDVGRADAGDEIDADPKRGEPRRLVGRRTAGLKRDRRPPVGAARQRPFRTDDDVGHHVADDEDARRSGSACFRLLAWHPLASSRSRPPRRGQPVALAPIARGGQPRLRQGAILPFLQQRAAESRNSKNACRTPSIWFFRLPVRKSFSRILATKWSSLTWRPASSTASTDRAPTSGTPWSPGIPDVSSSRRREPTPTERRRSPGSSPSS